MLARDERIDLLRFVGLAMIILAHAGPPSFLFQLRNFDVPLMVLMAGASFALSSSCENFGSYVWKRVKRLVLPVWLFLSCYFVVLTLTGSSLETLNAKTILGSYALSGGIGYVWIIRVLLMVAVVAPWLARISATIKDDKKYLLLLGAVLIAQEILRALTHNGIISLSLLHLLPYGVVFALGLRLFQLPTPACKALTVGSFALFLSLAVGIGFWEGAAQPTQAFKYPPSIYYLSYALGVSLALWLAAPTLCCWLRKVEAVRRIVFFAARNSIWIYLWHIPFIKLIEGPFWAKYIAIGLCPLLIVGAQVTIVKRWCQWSRISPNVKKRVRNLLTG